MKKKHFLCGLLMLCMMFTFSATTTKAEGSNTVTLDLADGPIDITPTGYSQDSKPEVAFTGAYIITGSLTTDTPLDIENNSGNAVTFDITLNNAQLIADTWCTATRIKGNSPIILNIKNIGDSKIAAFNHAAFSMDCTADVTINIENEQNSTLSLTREYRENSQDPITYSNDSPNAIISVYIDGEEINCKGTQDAHTYQWKWVNVPGRTIAEWFLNNKHNTSYSLVCPDCRIAKSRVTDLDMIYDASNHTESGTARYVATVGGVDYFSPEITIEAVPHSFSEQPAKAASCTEDGVEAHWTCELCDKLFADENGTTEIKQEDIKIAAGHSYKDGKCTVCKADDPNHVKPNTTPVTGNNNSSPQTGDYNDMVIWIMFLAMSCMGIIATIYYKNDFSH